MTVGWSLGHQGEFHPRAGENSREAPVPGLNTSLIFIKYMTVTVTWTEGGGGGGFTSCSLMSKNSVFYTVVITCCYGVTVKCFNKYDGYKMKAT